MKIEPGGGEERRYAPSHTTDVGKCETMKKHHVTISVLVILLLLTGYYLDRHHKKSALLQRQLIAHLQWQVVSAHWPVIVKQEQHLDFNMAASGGNSTKLLFCHPKLNCEAAVNSWKEAILPDFASKLGNDYLPNISIDPFGSQTNIVFTWKNPQQGGPNANTRR